MPLHKIIYPCRNCVIGTWEISESLEELNQLAKNEDIITSWMTIKIIQKQKEHIAARILLKFLCQKLGIVFHKVEKTPDGKPYLQHNQGYISYSHTDKYCAAIVHLDTFVGIDIEYPKSKLKKVAYKFLIENELKEFSQGQEELCKAWTAKEAVYKLIGRKGVSIKSDIKLFPENKIEVFGKTWEVAYEKTEDGYILAYIIE